MRSTRAKTFRFAVVSSLAVAVLATSGCGWIHSKRNSAYKMPEAQRPLEVPPDLDRPRTDGAMALPEATTSVTRSGTVAEPADSNVSFSATGARDAVFDGLNR